MSAILLDPDDLETITDEPINGSYKLGVTHDNHIITAVSDGNLWKINVAGHSGPLSTELRGRFTSICQTELAVELFLSNTKPAK